MFHLKIKPADLKGATKFILPGDPGRVEKVAGLLKDPKEISFNREFRLAIGTLEGEMVGVCSTGIGGPSTAICIEELAMCGVKEFLRIGTTGAIQKHIRPCDIIVMTGCVRLDGTSRHIAPIEYPAVASFEMLKSIEIAAAHKNLTTHFGVSASSDTFYQGQGRKDSFLKGFSHAGISGTLEELKHLNVLAFEMEASTVLTQTSCYGLIGGAIAGVLLNRELHEFPKESEVIEAENNVVNLGIETIKQRIIAQRSA